MHLCLYVDEILREIFGYITSQRRLYALSMTCRAFRDPATQLLWETLPNPMPIIRQLSCAGIIDPFLRQEWHDTELTDADWETVRRLSCRVRRLADSVASDTWLVGHGAISRPPGQGILYLSNARNPEVMFSNLRTLSLHIGLITHHLHTIPHKSIHDLIVGFLELVMKPHLTALQLIYCDPPEIHDKLLHILSSCQRIRNLALSGQRFDPRALCEVIPKLHELEVVRSEIRSWEVLRCLSHLPTLRCLIILSMNFKESFLTDQGKLPFPQLQVLHISVNGRVYLSEVLLCSILDNLTSLTITIGYQRYQLAEWLLQLLTLIPSQCPRLEYLCIVTSGSSTVFTKQTDMSALAPCLALCNLRVLVLAPCLRFVLTDEDVVQMAQSWPHLQHLHLATDWEQESPPVLTLHGISALAWHCPKLECISLLFDACMDKSPKDSILRQTAIRNECVRHMNVGMSPISSIHVVARILSCLFPRLEVIGVVSNASYTDVWRRVAAEHQNAPLIKSLKEYHCSDNSRRHKEQHREEWMY
ncbi:hypothetical protein V8B97DRAFT_1982365 [Scleroderma yunnanense]